MFASIVYPLPDELFISWLIRMCLANGCDDIMSFLKKYNDGKKARNRYISSFINKYGYDNFEYLYDLVDYAYEQGWFSYDGVELFLILSMVPEQACLMTDIRRNNIILNTFNSDHSFFPRTNDIEAPIHVCPVCMQNDSDKYGTFYYHKLHQMPGVCSCYIHGTTLIRLPRSARMEKKMIEYQISESPSDEQEYSLFVKQFGERQYDGESIDVATVIKVFMDRYEVKKRKDIGYMLEVLSERGVNIHCDDKVKIEGFYDQYKSERFFRFSSKNLLRILWLFYSSGEPVFEEMDKIVSIRADTIHLGEEYEVIKKYPYGVLRLKHTCGKQFIITDTALMSGYGCYKCDSDNPMGLFERRFELFSQGEYKLINVDEKQISIEHRCCGAVITGSTEQILSGITQCKCKNENNKRKVDGMLKESGNYDLIEYTTVNKIIRFKCLKCGEIIQRYGIKNLREFLEKGTHICEGDYEKAIYNVSGEGYTLLEIIKKERKGARKNSYVVYVRLKCKHCGKITEFNISDFLRGKRCSCMPRITFYEIKEVIENASQRYYTIRKSEVADSDNHYPVDIIEVSTGEVVAQKIDKLYAMQEISKPGLSQLNIKKEVDNSSSVYEIRKWLANITKKKRIFRRVWAENAIGIDIVKIRSGFEELINQSVIYPVDRSRDIYTLMSTMVTKEDVIRDIFLYDEHNNRVGCFWGQSAAIAHGIIKKPTDSYLHNVGVMTNVDIVGDDTKRNSLTLPNGDIIFFLKTQAVISEDTYLPFELLNMSKILCEKYHVDKEALQNLIADYKITKQIIDGCVGFNYQRKLLITYMEKNGIQFSK